MENTFSPAAKSRRSRVRSRSASAAASRSLNSDTLVRISAVCIGLILACYSALGGAAPPHPMDDERKTMEAPAPQVDERTIAKKYGLRELIYPDSEQVKTLLAFLTKSIDTGKCGPIPKTAVVVVLEFLQATINRQHITKGPRMLQDEFDALQTPYYVAARIISKIQRAHKEDAARTRLYQTTYLSLNHFLELLRSLLDPGCYWLRLKSAPEGVIEAMAVLREF